MFVYIITDKINDRINWSSFDNSDYFEIEEMGIENLNHLIENYNIIEFNTAIKPTAFKFLSKRYNASKIVYFDPDILVFNSLNDLWLNLDNYDFILTPHILKPIYNNLYYVHQVSALNTGVYNLGFMAVNYNETSKTIIDWWEFHMKNHGHNNVLKGEFYDQKIMNLLPIYTNKLLVEKKFGYNVAGWNIHERNITKVKNVYYANNEQLVFYHYSGVDKNMNKNRVSNYNDIVAETGSPLFELLNLYRMGLIDFEDDKFSKYECYYKFSPNIHKNNRWHLLIFRLRKIFDF